MKAKRILSVALCACMVLALAIVPAFAAGGNEIVEKGARWILDGFFWVGIVAAVIVLVNNVLKKNTTGIVVTIIVAAVVLTIIKSPTILTSLGDIFKNVLGLT